VIFRPELSDFEPIILDRHLTVLAIRNVVHNAIKYSYRAGVVEIFLTVEEDVAGTGRTIVIRVKDHGRGIKDSEKEKIFEPFMRGDGLIQTGNGLGLYCARMAARLQSGELILESSSPEGSVFQLRLPYARAGEAIHDVKADMPKKSPINRNWVLAMTGLLGFSFLTYLIFGPFGGSPPPPPMPTIEPTLMQATLTAEPTSYPKISLVSAHGQFVTALGEGDDWLVKQEPGLTECGVFDFIYLGDDTVALRTCYNRYITAPRMANNQPVPPHKEQFQLWQDSAMGDCGKFKVLDLDGYFIALKTCAGMVVTAGDGNWGPPMEWAVVAETDQVSSWEKFTQGTQP
jgi:hypothetical protein